VRQSVGEAFSQAAETAASGDRADAERVAAIRLLAYAPQEIAGDVLAELLSPQTSQRLQPAAVEALRQQPGEASGEILLEAWGTLSPAVRKAAVSAMLSQTARTTQLLSALGEGNVRPSDLESADRQMLLNHPRKPIREQAQKVLGQPTSADREAVIAQYTPALHEVPDLENGQAVFKKVCSTCHRIGNEGHVVGPDLTSVANKSPEDLLIALLDPN